MKNKIAGIFLVLSLILVNLPYVLGSEPLINQYPICVIDSIIPDPVHCEDPVNFTGWAKDPDEEKYFSWDIDSDGNYEIEDVYVFGSEWVSHTYTYTDGFTLPANINSIVYNVTLKVCVLSDCGYDTESYNVTAYPVADADGPYSGNAGEMITFNGSGSYDPNGHIVNWSWYFGDGTFGYGEITNHSYQWGGTYLVNLTVTDNLSGTGYNLTTAYINDPPDIPIITGPMFGKVGTKYEYSFISVNPDGDYNSYYIEWGDGSITNWTSFLPSYIPYSENHTWTSQGTYTIRAKAADTYGAESGWGTLTVIMPRNKATYNSFLLRFFERYPLLERFLTLLIK